MRKQTAWGKRVSDQRRKRAGVTRTELKRVFRTWVFWVACVIVLMCFAYAADFEFRFLAGRGYLSDGIWQEKFVELTGLGNGEFAGL